MVEQGYGRLEALMLELEKSALSLESKAEDNKPCVLIAPSWGKNALLDRLGDDFIEPLIESGFQVILRPHPQTWRLQRSMLEKTGKRYQHHHNFLLEDNVASKDSLIKADVMISDWSGAALEFALARLKPVLFVNVPRKVNNPDYETLGLEPFEARVRESIGTTVDETDAANMVEAVLAILQEGNKWEERIRTIRAASVYNLGKSAEVGAQDLMERLVVWRRAS